jgi:uncharacterized protein YjeT (DUF2065 family)
MKKKLLGAFLFHLAGIILLLLPNQYQGPVVTAFFNIPFRALDTTGIILILAGTVYIFTSLFLCLREQMNQSAQLPVDQRLKETD